MKPDTDGNHVGLYVIILSIISNNIIILSIIYIIKQDIRVYICCV